MIVSDWNYRWGELENGFGAILTGNIQISLTAPHLQGDLIIDESHPFHGPRFEAWERLAKVSKASGSLIIGQLSYPGRQALDAIVRKTVIAPSVVSFGMACVEKLSLSHVDHPMNRKRCSECNLCQNSRSYS